MRYFVRLTTTIALLLLLGGRSRSQNTTLDTARNTALSFFRTYDSIPYLTFDVKYTLFSDTVYSDFSYETMNGSYTMSGKKAKYSLGGVDYLQNDSFFLAVYHTDQQIVVSNPPSVNAGSYLPMRETLDSLLRTYSANYTIRVKTTTANPQADATGFISLTRKLNDTVAVYNRYLIEYNMITNVITKVEYEYTEPGKGLTAADEPDKGILLLKNTPRRKILRIEFSNYRFDNFSDQVYSENNYIWEEDGVYKPVDKFKSYAVYNARSRN